MRQIVIGITGLTWLILSPAWPSACAEDASEALRSMQDEVRKTNLKLADEIDRRLNESQRRVKERGRGHVVFGRVHVEGDLDPRAVVAQMFILEDGYFIGPTGDMTKPIGFRLTGFETTVVSPKGNAPIEDLGTIELKKLPANQLSSATVQVEFESHPKAPKLENVKIKWDLRPDPINTPSNGFEGYSSFYQPVTMTGDANGAFTVQDLSPGKYNVVATAPNCVQVSRSVPLEPGKKRQMKFIRFEMARKMNLEYAVSDNGSFDNSEFKKASVKAGDQWRASNKPYPSAFDLLIGQENETLILQYRYGPCYIQDLGMHELDDDLTIDEKELKSKQPQNTPALEGHVYIIFHQSWSQWILLRTTEVGKVAIDDPD